MTLFNNLERKCKLMLIRRTRRMKEAVMKPNLEFRVILFLIIQQKVWYKAEPWEAKVLRYCLIQTLSWTDGVMVSGKSFFFFFFPFFLSFFLHFPWELSWMLLFIKHLRYSSTVVNLVIYGSNDAELLAFFSESICLVV